MFTLLADDDESHLNLLVYLWVCFYMFLRDSFQEILQGLNFIVIFSPLTATKISLSTTGDLSVKYN